MKIPKKQIQKWINALRSGKYKQTKFALNDSKGYCCLGVACKEFIPKNKLLLTLDRGLIDGANPKFQVKAPDWLKDIDTDFNIRTSSTLSALNDRGVVDIPSFTFDEIADILQAVYIENVLDCDDL